MIRAVEFFSGIGAFSQAAKQYDIEVIAAFDQSTAANDAYKLNYGLAPRSKNLDSITGPQIPDADLWWMSPPCTPYTVRGKQKDISDPRAKSFVNLIGLIPEISPEAILVENVLGFDRSQVYTLLRQVLNECGYHVTQINLCSQDFGIPMRRPRLFLAATRLPIELAKPESGKGIPLSSFLGEEESDLILSPETVTKYGDGFDIADANDAKAEIICFTKGYARCMKASGSMLRSADGQLRRFSPEEILALLGFSADLVFPDEFDLQTKWRLLGNSVDVRAIAHILAAVMPCFSDKVRQLATEQGGVK